MTSEIEYDKQVSQLEEENDRLTAINRETWAEFALVGELLGVPDFTPYHARETVKAARAVMAENERLRAALRPFANVYHEWLRIGPPMPLVVTAKEAYQAAADALGEGGRE